MKTIIYNDVIEDIKKRMNDFDSKRFVKNVEIQKSNIISDKDVVKVEPIIMAKPDESSLFEVKKEEINVVKDKTKENPQPTKKPASGLFKSISDFFAENPEAVAAAKKKADEKRLLEIRVTAEKKRVADEKVALAKKIAEEKKLAEIQKKQEKIRLEEEKVLLEKKLIEEKRLADIEKKLAKLKKN